MSPQEKAAELRQKLEKWKSHNEVHAKPADTVLYEFLSAFLSLLEGDEDSADKHVELDQNETENENAASDEVQSDEAEEDTGGNHPPHEPGKP